MPRPKKSQKQTSEKPVTLSPLDFETAVDGLLGVKPDPKPKKAKPKAKKKAGRKKK